jgi:outer membrane protein assembly factor BamD (BamD/ComL family)
VHSAVDQGDLEKAGRSYLELVEHHGEQCLSRDAQLAIGNHLHATGDHKHAAMAYRQFTQRFTADSETNRVRLMHAILLARYLNDPIGAERELDAIEQHRLSEAELELAESLRQELA